MSPNPLMRVEQLAQSLAERIVPLIVDAIDVDAIIDRVDVDKIIERVDVEAIIDRVDVEKIIDRVDVEKIIDRVDVEKIIDRVDVQKIIDRVDINAMVDKVDIDALVEQTELGAIIARSTTGVLTEVLDVSAPRASGWTTSCSAGATGSSGVRKRLGPRWPAEPPDRAEPKGTRHDHGARPLGRAHHRPAGPLRRRGEPPGGLRHRRRGLLGRLHARCRADQRRPQAGHGPDLQPGKTRWWPGSPGDLGVRLLLLPVGGQRQDAGHGDLRAPGGDQEGAPIGGRTPPCAPSASGSRSSPWDRVPRHRLPARTTGPQRLHRRHGRGLRLGCPGRPAALDGAQQAPQAWPAGHGPEAVEPSAASIRSRRPSTMPRMSFTEVSRPHPQVAVVTLNRPERMNAMAFDVMIPFRDALQEIGTTTTSGSW